MVPSPAAPSASAGSTFTAKADGYTLTVAADRTELAPGDTVTFSVTFHNGTDKPIDLAGGCGGGASGLVDVPLPVDRQGKTWTGIRQAFKTYALGKAMGPGIVPALDPLRISMLGGNCGASAMSSELKPGHSVSNELSWKAEIVRGVDPLVGTIPFEISMGYDQLNGPPSQPPDGPMISWSPLFKSIRVEGQLEIIGQGRALKSAGEVIDGALADSTFDAWLASRPRTTWTNVNLFLVSSPNGEGILPRGPAWEIDLFREHNVPRNWGIVFVDPFDASIISGEYCNVPCDR